MEVSSSDISECESEIEISKHRKQNLVLPMHPMHAQPYHFLVCAPIFLQILEEQCGSPEGAW